MIYLFQKDRLNFGILFLGEKGTGSRTDEFIEIHAALDIHNPHNEDQILIGTRNFILNSDFIYSVSLFSIFRTTTNTLQNLTHAYRCSRLDILNYLKMCIKWLINKLSFSAFNYFNYSEISNSFPEIKSGHCE